MRALEIYWAPNFEHGVKDQFLKRYIVNRVVADGKEKQNLSDRLHRVLEALIDHETCSKERYRELLEILVTAVLQKFHSSREVSLRLDYTGARSRIHEDAFEIDCLHTAALLGISHMLDAIEIDVVSSWYSPYPRIRGVFHDSSLALATLGGQYQLVARIWKSDRNLPIFVGTMNVRMPLLCNMPFLAGHEDIVRLLLSSRDYWQACLHLHAEFALRFNRPSLFRLICDLCHIGPSEHPSLATAAKRGLEDVVKLCLDKGADVNEYWGHEWDIALSAAAFNGYKNIVRLLLANGADPHGCENKYPLWYAAKRGHKDVVEILLATGAVPCPDCNYRCPLVSAAHNGHAHIVECFLRMGLHEEAAVVALVYAASRGHETVVRLMIQHGVDKNGTERWSPMVAALERGHTHIIRTLLSLRADECEYADDIRG